MCKLDLFIGDKVEDRQRVISRLSVRMVVEKSGKYLMIGTKDGDLLFPGGGVEEGETLEEAGIRELREETGYICDSEPIYIGRVVTCRPDRFEEGYHYESDCRLFRCGVKDENLGLELTETEIECGYYRDWYSKDEILQKNQEYEIKIGQKDMWCKMVGEVLALPVLGIML